MLVPLQEHSNRQEHRNRQEHSQPQNTPPADGDAGAAAHVAELVENAAQKTAVQILREKKAQGSLTMSEPTYRRDHSEMWICKLSVEGNIFECIAARRKDAYQLCAAAALNHLGL